MIRNFLDERKGPGTIVLCAATPVIIMLGVFRIKAALSPYQIKAFLMHSEPIVLWANLLLCAFGLWWSRNELLRSFREISIPIRNRLLALFFLSLLLGSLVAPHTHGMYFDEDIYLNVAQNMLLDGKSEVTNNGYFRWDDYYCVEGYLNKQPNGYPALVSALFLLTGVTEKAAMILSVLFSALSVLCLFLCARELYDERVALWSALFLSLAPAAIIWSSSCSPEPALVFFSLLSLFLLSLYLRTRLFRVAFAAFMVLAFAVQLRPEGIIIIPLALLFLVLFHTDLIDHLKDFRLFLIFLPFWTLIAHHALHFIAFMHGNWGASYGPTFSTAYFPGNVHDNLAFFITNRDFPLLFALCAAAGLLTGLRRPGKLAFVLSWFFTFFVPYLFFYAGSYNHQGSLRFSLLILCPVSLLCGLGIQRICSILENWLPDGHAAGHYATAILFVAFMFHLPLIRTPDVKMWEERFSHDFIAEEARKLPHDAVIFSNTPPVIILTAKRGALQSYYGSDMEKVNQVFARTRHVYFYRDYWCYTPTLHANYDFFCEVFNLTPVASEKRQGMEYTLFRVEKRQGEKVAKRN